MLAVLGAASLAAVLPGCATKDTSGSLVAGKTLFVQKCGACHTLSRAATKGTTGPNLDFAFAQSRKDGIPSDTIQGVVHRQILYPAVNSGMPGKLVKGDDARAVARYVATVAAKPGQDTGLLASIGQTQKKEGKEQGGKLTIPTDPSGQLAFLVASATGTPGPIEIDTPNKASIPHNIALEGPGGVAVKGPVVQNGGVSKITAKLKPGVYTFYCSVPGHRQGGMVGKITVR